MLSNWRRHQRGGFTSLLALLLLGLCGTALSKMQQNEGCSKNPDYCSCGELKARSTWYLGHLDEAAEIKQALAMTAHKKEVIITAETRPMTASQFVSRFYQAGYCHVLIVMDSAAHCAKLQHNINSVPSYPGNVSCATYRSEDEDGQPLESKFRIFRIAPRFSVAWWWKYHAAARAAALGYNVMMVDTDTLPLADFYWRVKQPPMAQFNMFSQAEAWTAINGGFSYVQNAASNGAVVWVLYELMHRTVRALEDDSALRAAAGGHWNPSHIPMDQEIVSDTMVSAAYGTIIFNSFFYDIRQTNPALEAKAREIWMNAERVFNVQEFEIRGDLAKEVFEQLDNPTGGMQLAADGSVRTTLRWATLRVPEPGKFFPQEVRPYPFGPPGKYTELLRKSFRDLGVELPVESEAIWGVAKARAAPAEKYALAQNYKDDRLYGAWVVGVYGFTALYGGWHTHLKPKQAPAIGHTNAGSYHTCIDQKGLALKHTGHFDWSIAERARGPGMVYYTSMAHGEPLGRVVAFKPGVVTSKLSFEQYQQAAHTVAQIAVVLNAVATWPGIPCDADYSLSDAALNAINAPAGASLSARDAGLKEMVEQARGGRMPLPWAQLKTAHRAYPYGGSLNKMKCDWGPFMNEDCLVTSRHPSDPSRMGRGLLGVELDHLLGEDVDWALGSDRLPRPHGTKSLQQLTLKCGAASSTPPQPGSTTFVSCELSDLLADNSAALLALPPPTPSEPHVLWLDRLWEPRGIEAMNQGGNTSPALVYKRWHDRCPGLHFEKTPQNLDWRRWRRHLHRHSSGGRSHRGHSLHMTSY